MQAPTFWTRPPGPLARALWPLGLVWAAVTRRRMRRPGLRLPVPVICVGNLTAGGTGKTPTVIALAERLSARGVAVHVVTRGHGGRLDGPVQVDPRRHGAEEVGDEPLLIAAFAPVWVAKDRAAGGRAAVAAGAQAVLLDDGFQNPALVKDLSILVVDGETVFGNGFCIPAGPLREPVAEGLSRAGLVLAVGGDPAAVRAACRGLPVVPARILPRPTGMPWEGQKVVAFAGIGRPEKFFATLRNLGADVVAAHPLPDHAPLSPRLMARLQREAEDAGAMLVATDKDAVRLPRAALGRVMPLPVALQPEDWGPLDAAVRRVLGAVDPRG